MCQPVPHQPFDATDPGSVVVAADVGSARGDAAAVGNGFDDDVDGEDQRADLVHGGGHDDRGAGVGGDVAQAAVAGIAVTDRLDTLGEGGEIDRAVAGLGKPV